MQIKDPKPEIILNEDGTGPLLASPAFGVRLRIYEAITQNV